MEFELIRAGDWVRWLLKLNEPAPLPQPDCDRPLVEAFHDLGRRLRPGGPDGEIDEWSIYDESLRRLVRWAEEAGCFYENLQPLKEGGREHDLTFIKEGAYWLKFTKPAAAGYVVSFESGVPALEPALPLEYLERLMSGCATAQSLPFILRALHLPKYPFRIVYLPVL